jgi:hypothetical protein
LKNKKVTQQLSKKATKQLSKNSESKKARDAVLKTTTSACDSFIQLC